MGDARIPIAGPTELPPEAAHGRLYQRDELLARLADPTLTIADVLPRVAFEDARIPGSLCLPLDEIPQRARTLLPDMDQEIALYCGGPTCPLSEQAVGQLLQMGYHKVGHYPGGILEWTEVGCPVETGPEDAPRRVTASASASASETGGNTSSQSVASAAARNRGTAFVRGLRARPRSWIERLANVSYGGLIWRWFAMVGGLGLAYWMIPALHWGALRDAGAPVEFTLPGLLTALYFSAVTATSVGFGDVVPIGILRLLAVVEGAAGLLLFGCIISKLVSARQEMLVEETHRTAFEDRLERVRTNLHLVLSELQTIAITNATQGSTSERALARLESVAMMLAGELRTIHDLLYHPQQAPDEYMLEGLLAGLAADLRELADLVAAAPQARERSPLLGTTLLSVRTLAGEVCGECVPRQYAPHLKVWMDRIQEYARTLAP